METSNESNYPMRYFCKNFAIFSCKKLTNTCMILATKISYCIDLAWF